MDGRHPTGAGTGRALTGRPVLLGACLSLLTPPCAWAQQGVEGVVVDAVTENPIDHAGVVLADSSGVVHGSTVSDSVGHFALVAPAAGPYLLHLQRPGFIDARSLALQIPRNVTISVRVSLTPGPVMLEAITVFGEAPPRLTPELEGFLARRRMRVGYSFSREEIQRMRAEHPVDLLREVPGFVTLGNRPAQRTYVLNWRRCPPAIFVDGQLSRLPENELLENLSLWNVYGVEVYRDRSSVPGEYLSQVSQPMLWRREPDPRCGVVLIWTRAVEW